MANERGEHTIYKIFLYIRMCFYLTKNKICEIIQLKHDLQLYNRVEALRVNKIT
jgi:hypothetical protein